MIGNPVALRAAAENAEVSMDDAIAIGLIINETVANALKYAFPDDRAGNITVSFHRSDREFHLTVRDDGIGMNGQARPTGLGQRLVQSFAHQLGGTVEWNGPPGTTVLVRFPQAEPVPVQGGM